MKTTILYRNDVDWQLEKDSAAKYFDCISSRMLLPKNSIIIPRFSALPFYRELEEDVNYIGSKLINSFEQHRYIADLQNWVYDLHDVTPETWKELWTIPEQGPFVLKGETNSKKYHWRTHMFAQDKKEAIQVHSRLTEDSVLQYQQIYIRKYVELEKLANGLQGLQVSREYRFFIYKRTILSGGFYWSSHEEELKNLNLTSDEVPKDFLENVIDKIQTTELSEPPNFYVIDVAKTVAGEWIVIELNDGSMSGLSCNDPDTLYKNLKTELEKEI
jgi:hypothetical protein